MKFIHFGCWNNIDCEKTNYRDLVIDYISKTESDYSFIIVSGDNWYSNKIDDAKYYFTNVLHSGLIKLYKLNKPCYIILGNHDEDNDGNKESPLKENCMLNTEKYFINNINNIDEKNVYVPSLQYLYNNTDYKIRKNAQLILYEGNEKPETLLDKDILYVFINTNIFTKYKNESEIYRYIENIRSAINSEVSFKKLFVIGHDPITSLSEKYSKEIKTRIHNNNDILKHFIDVLSFYDAVYLCADTHNFQISTINNIIQIVGGTGGAGPNILPDIGVNRIRYTLKNNELNNIASVDGYYHNSYGYSVIDIDEEFNTTVSYKHLVDNENNVVNRKYIYKITKDEDGDTVFKLDEEYITNVKEVVDTKELQEKLKNICQNMTKENLVKDSDDILCYKKKK